MPDNSDYKISKADVLRIIDEHSTKVTERSGYTCLIVQLTEYEAMVKEIEEL